MLYFINRPDCTLLYYSIDEVLTAFREGRVSLDWQIKASGVRVGDGEVNWVRVGHLLFEAKLISSDELAQMSIYSGEVAQTLCQERSGIVASKAVNNKNVRYSLFGIMAASALASIIAGNYLNQKAYSYAPLGAIAVGMGAIFFFSMLRQISKEIVTEETWLTILHTLFSIIHVPKAIVASAIMAALFWVLSFIPFFVFYLLFIMLFNLARSLGLTNIDNEQTVWIARGIAYGTTIIFAIIYGIIIVFSVNHD